MTKCDRLYYKVRQVLQSVTAITKLDVSKCCANDSNNDYVGETSRRI